MKLKLSVRDFKAYVDSGTRLEFRAWNTAWAKLYPSDAKRAKKLWQEQELKMRQDKFAEALFIHDGDIIAAEQSLVNELIAPPSFTDISNCNSCGILPARPRIQSGEERLEPFCAFCGIISVEQQEL